MKCVEKAVAAGFEKQAGRLRSRPFLASVASTLCIALISSAMAQSYPSKPLKIVVGTAVGTPIDILSRVVADKLTGQLGQPVLVENRVGAGGTVGSQEVLRQPSDGYTLMNVYMPMTVVQTIMADINYNLVKDFTPVGQFAWSYNVLAVHPSVNANTPRELAELLRVQPGKFSFASGGPGTPAQLAGELFKMETKTDALHVPYAQFPQAISDLVAGRHQFMFGATPPLIPQISGGKLRALAVTGPQRLAALKDVPTMAESGYPDFVVRDWQGLAAKAGTPRDIVMHINGNLAKVLEQGDVRQAFGKLGADTARGSPEEFGRLIATEIERWGKVARAANIKLQ
ncbi:MAG: Bug family tripartite tricarboxylate transporter substrate binding protein [Burkholderiales bacterium]